MVEATQEDSYSAQMGLITDATLKENLQALYDAGYIDFEENKIMIESNPAMSLDDIMACIDESKREEGTNLEDLSGEQSSDAAGEGLEAGVEHVLQSRSPRRAISEVPKMFGKSVTTEMSALTLSAG